MSIEAKIIEMLSSPYPQVRLAGLEQAEFVDAPSPAMMNALDIATRDQDFHVSNKAKQVINLELHRKMAIEMGISLPAQSIDVSSNQVQSEPAVHRPLLPPDPAELRAIEKSLNSIPDLEEGPNGIELLQVFTFTFGVPALIFIFLEPSEFYAKGFWGWFSLLMGVVYLGVQIYAFLTLGFLKSFHFLKYVLKASARSGK